MKKLPLIILGASLLVSACQSNKHNIVHSSGNTLENANNAIDYTGYYGYYKVGKPYRIKGKRYVPKQQPNYNKNGVASWYGPNFHNKKTANGDIFDQNALTAAHKTLPLPSVVQVTNLENGRSLRLVVNDRGPFAHDRIIDVSKRGAEVLGFKHQGTANVQVKLLRDETQLLVARLNNGSAGSSQMASNTTTAPAAAIEPSNYAAVETQQLEPLTYENNSNYSNNAASLFIQAGSFANYSNADKTRRALQNFGKTSINTITVNNQTYHQVRLGPISGAFAEEQLDTIKNEVTPHAILVSN